MTTIESSRPARAIGFACAAALAAACADTVSLSGRVKGLAPGVEGLASATLRGEVFAAELDGRGGFELAGLTPGRWLVEARVDGYDTGVAVFATVPGPEVVLAATPLPDEGFVFRWRADASEGGAEHATTEVGPFVVDWGDPPTAVADSSAAHRLAREFQVALVDLETAWTPGHAQAVLTTLRELPDLEPRPSRWSLTDGHLAHDVVVEPADWGTTVRVSRVAFTYAVGRMGSLGGRSGRLSSRRLLHAVSRWLTAEGRDAGAVDVLLRRRHGASIVVPDYAELTKTTTAEGATRFQDFAPEELLLVLEQLEELPPPLHAIPGLTYLVRRLDGTRHPMYPQAPAVSWPKLEEGYIEFTEGAFRESALEHVQRLVLHEKAHFFWERVLAEEDREAWAELGQWFETKDSPSGWSTRDTTGFVSPYAHAVNPDEDLAESIAWFVINPDKLRSRSMAKYDFVSREIMEDAQYVSLVREDLAFVVENERPDYVYPGRVQEVEVAVVGEPEEDKVAFVEIELRDGDGDLDDAQGAVLRMTNEAGVHEDLRLAPVDANGEPLERGSRLTGKLKLSRFAKGGFWTAGQLVVKDTVGNERYERGGNYGWKMFVESPLEDVEEPEYVAGSLRVKVEREERGGQPVQVVVATWKVSENTAMAADARVCSTSLVRVGDAPSGSLTTYGTFDAESSTCTTRTSFHGHRKGGRYVLTFLTMRDAAGNSSRVYFTEGEGDEEPRSVKIESLEPDEEPPELDLDDIRVSAAPVNPESPNGETRVTVVYFARDDKSGLGNVSLQLRDPLGGEQVRYHYHENFHGPVFGGDPTEWKRYECEFVLPIGSPPGVWGVTSMNLNDKAGNAQRHDFTETIRFELVEN